MSRLRRVVAPLLGLVASIVLLVLARDLDRFARGDQLGPGFWPRLCLAGLGAACLVKLIGEWRPRRRRVAAARAESIEGQPDAAEPISRSRLAVAIGLIVLYVLAAPSLGFPLATAAFIGGFMWLCGARSVAGITASAGFGTVGLLYLFVKLVYLPLPKGAGPFEAATLVVYRALRIF